MCPVVRCSGRRFRLAAILLLALTALAPQLAQAGVEILWPKTPPEWGLLLNPGAQRKPEEYRALALRIQEESPVALAVGIASFTANWPEPFQMKSALQSFKQQVAQRALEPLGDEKFLVAGHSMAGIIVQELPAHEKIGGVILLGAYPSNDILRLGHGLRKAGIPTLILAGEWDGLTRITRVLDTVLECEGLTADHPDYKRCLKQRVVVLPGVNHSDFANGVLQKGDLASELDVAVAHTEIARAVAGYWSDVLVALPESLRQPRWKDLVADTRTWAAAWAKLDALDLAACKQAQMNLLPADSGVTWDVEVRNVESVPGFVLAKPTVEKVSENHWRVVAVQSQDRPFNPLDLSVQSRAFTRLSCKLKSEEALRRAASLPPLDLSLWKTCGQLNTDIYQHVSELLPVELKERLTRRGLDLVFGDDLMVDSGVKWISSKPVRDIDLDQRRAVVSVPRLQTTASAPRHLEGMHYCQFVPPTQLGEWVFFDAFKLVTPPR